MLTDEHLYTITRTEFAKEIGKSRDAVKKDMQRGKYKDQYIFKNGKYFFKSQETMREKQVLSPMVLSPVKPKVNRGGHEMAVKKGRYPNQAFANHNHMKKMIALRGKMTPEELALVPTVEKMVKAERQKQLRDQLEVKPRVNSQLSMKHYGHMLTPHEMLQWDYKPTNRGRKKKWKNPYG
jgi:hypothetical protein